MNLPALDFRQLVVLFVSLGPHKQRELAIFASVSPDTVARWYHGVARPMRGTENHLRTYLLAKLSDLHQLELDQKKQSQDLQAAVALVERTASTWDAYIETLEDSHAVEAAQIKKTSAVLALKRQLFLP